MLVYKEQQFYRFGSGITVRFIFWKISFLNWLPPLSSALNDPFLSLITSINEFMMMAEVSIPLELILDFL
jgi:hypothetical protein